MWKIVIVDDDTTTLNGLRSLVDWKSFDVEVVGTAHNGQEGLKQIELHQPDLILTDIYMPVMNGIEMLKQIREQGNQAEVIILSGYEDFQYARSAVKLNVIDYLSKPATLEKIEKVISESIHKLIDKREKFNEAKELEQFYEVNLPMTQKMILKGFLESHYDTSQMTWLSSKFLDMDTVHNHFAAFMIEYEKNHQFYQRSEYDWLSIQCTVNDIVNEMIEKNPELYLIENQANMIIIIVSSSDEADVYLKAKSLGARIIDNIKKLINLQVWVAIGKTVSSLHSIRESYNEALELLAERENLMNKSLLTREDLVQLSRQSQRRPIEYYHSITALVISGQTDMTRQKIDEFIDYLTHLEGLNLNELRNIAVEFIGVLMTALYNQALSMEENGQNINIYKEVGSIQSIHDFHEWTKERILPFCKLMSSKSSDKHKKTIDYIIRFVNDHYDEEITLDMISNKVFLTANYLSQIFKNSQGENFKNYVTRIRIEKAKEMMLQGNLKIYEIAEKVGYNNTAYFSQLFRKHTGLTPSEFNR